MSAHLASFSVRFRCGRGVAALPSLLIIDDDVALLARMGLQLEDAGFQIEKSSDLSHGEQLYVEHRPDMVILEVRTGNDKGWDLLRRLAAETPVLVLSGASREEDVVRALDEGAVDYLTKPYRSIELVARIRARMALTVAVGAPTPVQKPVVTFAPIARPVAAPASESAPARVPPTAALNGGIPSPLHPSRRNTRRGPTADESVFMSEAEEMALLRTPAPPLPHQAVEPAPQVGEGGLGRQMRAERIQRHLTLVQIENELKIRMSYLQAMEDEKFTLLPRGPAAPQMLKTYADYLGLDATTILDELKAQNYSVVVTPLPALGGIPLPRTLPRWLLILLAVGLALIVGVGAILIFDPNFFARLPAFFQGLWAQFMGLFGVT